MPQRRESDNDIIVEKINKFVDQNNLSDHDSLLWLVLKHNYIDGLATRKHVESESLHTPKGLLVRTSVITWAIFIMIIISTVVAYLPEQVAMLTP